MKATLRLFGLTTMSMRLSLCAAAQTPLKMLLTPQSVVVLLRPLNAVGSTTTQGRRRGAKVLDPVCPPSTRTIATQHCSATPCCYVVSSFAVRPSDRPSDQPTEGRVVV